MSVHQLPDGRWYCQYRLPGRKNKKREYFGRGAVGRAAAYSRDDTVKAEKDLIAARKNRDPGPTFTDLANAYLQGQMGSMAASSLDNLLYKLAGVIKPAIGHLPAHKITHARLDAYVAKRLQSVKRTTIHREITDIMAIMNWATARQIITINPCAGYKKPRRDDEIIQPATVEETKRLLANASDHLRRAIMISFYCGLRPGNAELYRLKWEAVDWQAQTLFVVSAKKGGLRSRVVPLHDTLYKSLQGWFDADGRKTDRHIITWRGKPVKSIKKAFRTAKKKAGITRRLTLYALRHAFATMALAAGGDLKSTSEMMGHSRPDTTMRIYQHTNIALHRQAVDRLPDVGPLETRKNKRVTKATRKNK